MAYAEVTDLLTGSIPLPAYIDRQKSLDDAADEVDSYLAGVYATPILLPTVPSGVTDQYRQTRLILKRINAQLASGRIITAAAAGGEDSEVHAYGLMLIREAIGALKVLAAGTPLLPGATTDAGYSTSDERPLITNGDPFSQVDAFYGMVAADQAVLDPSRTPIYPTYYGRG